MKRRNDRCSSSTNVNIALSDRTGAAKPTLWPTLSPCHFTVPCFIFKTKTFSFSSKQALSNNVFVVKITHPDNNSASRLLSPKSQLFPNRATTAKRRPAVLSTVQKVRMVRSTRAGAGKLFERIVRRRRDMQRLIPYRTRGMVA